MILERSAVAIGLMAALVAVGGFLGRAFILLPGGDSRAIERGTVIGGLWGMVGAVGLILVDALTG